MKIIDLGFSVDVTKPHDASIYCGTPSYMAPEIIKRDNPNPIKTDIWALGILLFYFICGAFPFRGQQSKDVYAKILKGSFTIPDAVPS